VSADEIADRHAVDGVHRVAAGPVPSRIGLHERLLGHAVQLERRRRDPVEPALLDHVDARGAIAIQQLRDIGPRRVRPSPERAARALAREPVEAWSLRSHATARADPHRDMAALAHASTPPDKQNDLNAFASKSF